MATMTETKPEARDAASGDALPTGVTFSGRTFKVPPTHDMVKTLFDPTVRKSYLEMAIVVILLSNFLVFLIPSNQMRILVFIGLYIIWRLGYNFGIGYLLHNQLNYNRLVKWAEHLQLFTGSSPLAKFAQAEVRAQRGPTYDVSAYPIEFNTWLIFRKVVDLILMSDFTAFICLVIACAINDDFQFIKDQPMWLIALRLVVGWLFILFNLWVKVNAHNTIKDYAWYWGDFFFRQINNEDLIFDGVFEMVPHPMYSVGYIGYYGFALIAKSYTVLMVAIFGHFLQMIFLHFIENPHIDKIYGPLVDEINLAKVQKLRDLKLFHNMKPMVGLMNFTWLRASDVANVLLAITYAVVLPMVMAASGSGSSRGAHVLFWVAVTAKVIELVLIDILLALQLSHKFLTKWCLSLDMPVELALNNWAVMYNTLINLTYTCLVGFNVLQYISLGLNPVFFTSYYYLRIFLGMLLIFTQTWINVLIVESIGYFGWFYGDFFVPRNQRAATHLTKAGVYRYLNNPEQIFGVCGVMGVFLMFPTMENFVLCLLWVANNFIRINFIERAHMIKVYGEEVFQDSGVTKTFKKHLIPEALQRRFSNDHEMRQRSHRSRTKLISITETIDLIIRELKDTNQKISKQKIRELLLLLEFENSEFLISIDNLHPAENSNDEYMPSYTTVGTPIKVSWKLPADQHNPKNWIGLYRIAQTSYLRHKTLLSLSGRWTFVDANTGSYVFEGEQLFWEEGVYEFRFHLDGKHEVAYISEPFEIKCPKVTVPTTLSSTEELAESLKSAIFAPLLGDDLTIDEPISRRVQATPNMIEIYKRIAYLVLRLTDIKINTKVFLSTDDENAFTIRTLLKKLINIRLVLDDLSYSFLDLETKKDE